MQSKTLILVFRPNWSSRDKDHEDNEVWILTHMLAGKAEIAIVSHRATTIVFIDTNDGFKELSKVLQLPVSISEIIDRSFKF